MDYKRRQHSPQRKTRIAELLQPEPQGLKTPLSERPRDGHPKDTSFVDKLELHKESPKTDEESQPKPDVSFVMEDTHAVIKYGLRNSKQQQQIQNELKALLEHEQKIIDQIFDRANKFKDFKDEFKKSGDEFEEEHNMRIPFYAKYLKQLAELPETQNVTQEGMPRAVQAKILYNIVENTTHVANNTIVQLSMEKTLMNDIDLSMQKLRNFADFMKTNFQTWNKNIATQEKNLEQIMNSYNKLFEDANNLKPFKEEDDAVSEKQDQEDVMKTLEDRLRALEDQIKAIKDQAFLCCEGREPATGSSLPPQHQRVTRQAGHSPCASGGQRKQYVDPCHPNVPRGQFQRTPECLHKNKPPSRIDNSEGPSSPLRDDVDIQYYCPPSQEDRLYAGQDKIYPQPLSLISASSSQKVFTRDSFQLSQEWQQGMKLFSPNSNEEYPYSHSGSPLGMCFPQDAFEIPHSSSESVHKVVSQNLLEMPSQSQEHGRCEEHSVKPPTSTSELGDMQPPTAEDYCILRSQALPENQLDLPGTPGMNLPVPHAVLGEEVEREECIPLSPEDVHHHI